MGHYTGKKLSCLAIGDYMIPSAIFDNMLSSNSLFSHYHSIQWQQGMNGTRAEFRNVVRQIEIKGYKAYPVQDDILKAVEDVDVLFLHLFPVPDELIRRAKRLQYIMTARGGLENVDIEAANEFNVKVINCPEHNALAVAEYTIGLILDEMRNISRSNMALKAGTWRERYDNTDVIPELNTSIVGLVGFGVIGRLVAKRIRAFDAKILVYDPFVDPATIEAYGCIPAVKEELLRSCDVISLHARMSKGAAPVIGTKELSMMKPNAILINTARAGLVDTHALYAALKEKKIMGAALDVFPIEPLPPDYSFLTLDNVTITNHRGGDTLNSYIKAPEILLGKLLKALS